MTLQITDQTAQRAGAKEALTKAWEDLKENATRGLEFIEAEKQLHDFLLTRIPRIADQFNKIIELDNQAGKILSYSQRTNVELLVNGLKAYHLLSEMEGTMLPGAEFCVALKEQLSSVAKKILAPLLSSYVTENAMFRASA